MAVSSLTAVAGVDRFARLRRRFRLLRRSAGAAKASIVRKSQASGESSFRQLMVPYVDD